MSVTGEVSKGEKAAVERTEGMPSFGAPPFAQKNRGKEWREATQMINETHHSGFCRGKSSCKEIGGGGKTVEKKNACGKGRAVRRAENRAEKVVQFPRKSTKTEKKSSERAFPYNETMPEHQIRPPNRMCRPGGEEE